MHQRAAIYGREQSATVTGSAEEIYQLKTFGLITGRGPWGVHDRPALIDALLARGATRVNIGQDESEASWTVLADPEGNEFCVLSARDS